MLSKVKNTTFGKKTAVFEKIGMVTIERTTIDGLSQNLYTWQNQTIAKHTWQNGKGKFWIDKDLIAEFRKLHGIDKKVKQYVHEGDRVYACNGDYKKEIHCNLWYDFSINKNGRLALIHNQYFGGDGIGDQSGDFYVIFPLNCYFDQIPSNIEIKAEEGMRPSVNTEMLWYEDEDTAEEVFHDPTEEDYKAEIDLWLEFLHQNLEVIIK